MTIRLLAVLGMLAVSACAKPSGPAGRCANAADSDPAYKRALAIAAGNASWQWQHAEEMARMRRTAIARCEGAASGYRGGVEQPDQ